MSSPPPVPSKTELLFDACKMCGHMEITEENRCANCGEPVVGSELEIASRPRGSIFNWRTIVGFVVILLFAGAVYWNYQVMQESLHRDREFRMWIGYALACGVVCGFVYMVQGIFRGLRRRVDA